MIDDDTFFPEIWDPVLKDPGIMGPKVVETT
jgi:hypothetical protein